MIRTVTIARVTDGLPLAATMESDEKELAPYKGQAKQLFRKLADASPARCSISTGGDLVFHYSIEDGVCYLALCDEKFSKKLAFAFLDELQQEFQPLYGDKVATAARPYSFIEFDGRMQKLKRSYEDSRAAHRNLGKINTELQDVHRIMFKNIDDVLDRGSALDSLSDKASMLRGHSEKYRKDAQQLKWKAMMRKYGPIAAVSFIVLVFLYFYFGL